MAPEKKKLPKWFRSPKEQGKLSRVPSKFPWINLVLRFVADLYGCVSVLKKHQGPGVCWLWKGEN